MEELPNLARVTFAMRCLAEAMRRSTRAFERATDGMKRYADAEIRDLGRGWEHPELLLEEDDLERLDIRALGRTLAEIDDLPTT